MKATKRELLDDLIGAVADLYAKSDDYLRNAKAYHCRSMAETRAGLVKGAAVMRMDASKIQALIDKHKDSANGQVSAARVSRSAAGAAPATVAEVGVVGEADTGPHQDDAQRADQAQGQLDVPSLRSGHDGTGSRPHTTAE